jgi:hypothetical protein
MSEGLSTGNRRRPTRKNLSIASHRPAGPPGTERIPGNLLCQSRSERPEKNEEAMKLSEDTPG